MSLAEILNRCRERIENPDLREVAAWKAAHPEGKACGAFPVYVPFEVIAAAGMLPVPTFGGGTAIEVERADARIQSFVCAISRSTLELGMTGRFEGLDAFVFPTTCDVARNLSGIWTHNFPKMRTVYLHLPQNVESSSALAYGASELRRLGKALGEVSGHPPDTEDLRRSILEYNALRRLLRRLYQLRQEPGRLGLAECAILVRGGVGLPIAEHTRMLEAALAALGDRPPRRRDTVKVVLEGAFCEQPPLELLQVMEEAGCEVVDDDLALGMRWFQDDVPEHGDPWEALSEAYRSWSPCTAVKHGRAPREAAFLEKIRRAKAAGVVFAAPKFCEPALLDYVLLKSAVQAAGLPYLCFEYEEKMSVFESVRSQVETFVESILFYPAAP